MDWKELYWDGEKAREVLIERYGAVIKPPSVTPQEYERIVMHEFLHTITRRKLYGRFWKQKMFCKSILWRVKEWVRNWMTRLTG